MGMSARPADNRSPHFALWVNQVNFRAGTSEKECLSEKTATGQSDILRDSAFPSSEKELLLIQINTNGETSHCHVRTTCVPASPQHIPEIAGYRPIYAYAGIPMTWNFSSPPISI
jgi:hypothetical protein